MKSAPELRETLYGTFFRHFSILKTEIKNKKFHKK